MSEQNETKTAAQLEIEQTLETALNGLIYKRITVAFEHGHIIGTLRFTNGHGRDDEHGRMWFILNTDHKVQFHLKDVAELAGRNITLK